MTVRKNRDDRKFLERYAEPSEEFFILINTTLRDTRNQGKVSSISSIQIQMMLIAIVGL